MTQQQQQQQDDDDDEVNFPRKDCKNENTKLINVVTLPEGY